MKKSIIAVILVVVIVVAGYGGYAFYSIDIQSNGGNSCIPYLRTDCGGDHNIISYDTSTGDITVGHVSQSYGATWYNVAVAYVPGTRTSSPRPPTSRPTPPTFRGTCSAPARP